MIVLVETPRAVSCVWHNAAHSVITIFPTDAILWPAPFANFASSRCTVWTLVHPWVCDELWSDGLLAHCYLETGESDCPVDQAFTMHAHIVTQ